MRAADLLHPPQKAFRMAVVPNAALVVVVVGSQLARRITRAAAVPRRREQRTPSGVRGGFSASAHGTSATNAPVG